MNVNALVPQAGWLKYKVKQISVTEKAFLVFSVPVLFLLVILALLASVQRLTENEQEFIWQARDNTTQTESLLKDLVDADNYLQVALISNDHDFMVIANHSIQEIKTVVSQLQFQTWDNPSEEKMMQDISRDVAEQLSYFAQVQHLIGQGDRAGAAELIKQHSLTSKLTGLRLNIIAFLQQESSSETQRQLRLIHAYQQLSWQLGIIVPAAILFSLLGVFQHNRWVSERIASLTDKAQQATRDKDVSVFDTTGSDEISSLARAMSKMAEAAMSDEQPTALALSDVFCSVGPDGKILKIGRGCIKAWGYSPGELIDTSLLDLVSEDTNSLLAQWFVGLMCGNLNMDLETCILHKNGSKTYNMWFGYWSESENRIFAVAHDVTARKLAEIRQSVQYSVTSILAESEDLTSDINEILKTICAATGWSIGAFWIVDEALHQIRCVDVYYPPNLTESKFVQETKTAVRKPGQGLPGKTWMTGHSLWIQQLENEVNSARAAAALEGELHGAITFPVLLHGETLGVIEFFSEQIPLPDDGLLQMFSTIGGLLGQFMQRTRLEEQGNAAENYQRVISNVRYLRSPMINTERILASMIEGKSGQLQENQLELLRKIRRGNKAVLGLVQNIVEEQGLNIGEGTQRLHESIDDTLEAINEYCSR